MMQAQAGILADVPRLSRYLTFGLLPGGDPAAALKELGAMHLEGDAVVGLGSPLVEALGRRIEGLRVHPALTGRGVAAPSTPAALWLWLRGDDRGELLHKGRTLTAALSTGFELESVVDGFKYGTGRDLSGYEDGTENPHGEAAATAALVRGRGPGLDGSSFVANQVWVHDLDAFEVMGQAQRDNVIGRRLSDNEELADAPPAAHVKRTAQESFEPPAFVLRRSMPWADANEEGLVFVAFGASLDPFEQLLRRMLGHDDEITDALFSFSRPVTGSYYWCPPVRDRCLDLSALFS